MVTPVARAVLLQINEIVALIEMQELNVLAYPLNSY